MYVIIEHSDQQLLLNFLDYRQHLKSNSFKENYFKIYRNIWNKLQIIFYKYM